MKAITSIFSSFLGILCLMSCGNTCNETNVVYNNVDTAQIVYENIMSRRSVRKYLSTPVERSKMDTIIKCGINAPNGMNRQSYEIRVVDNPEYINGITEVYKKYNPDVAKDSDFKNMFRNAPTIVFIAADSAYDMSQIDCGLLGENMILSAWSMGIGSCCLGSPVRFMLENKDAKEYLDRLGFSQGFTLSYVIAFGYPDESPAAKPRKTDMVKYLD